jgi:hypothetical protein
MWLEIKEKVLSLNFRPDWQLNGGRGGDNVEEAGG